MGAKILDFKLATIFCIGYCLSKHKITRHSKHLGGPWLFCLPGYAYVS